MKINKLLSIALLSVIALVSCEKSKKTAEVKKQSKPNVVYILTDQWRGSALGYAGDPNVKTPNLDNFAKEAVNFTNAVSVTPVCTPHRAALLTGRFPTSTGMFLNDIYLPSEELCMAEIFKAEGYNTAYLGKWHLDGHGRLNNVIPERRQGFDYWKGLECSHNYTKMPYYENDDPEMKYWEGYSPNALTKDANKYLSDHAKSDDPFLLFISIATPHYPHNSAPKKFKDMYPQESLKLAPNVSKEWEERTRKELQGYYAHCTATDEAIGTVLDKIKELNLLENTIVVFSSDHGEMMGAHGVKPFVKQLAWDEALRVPFLISYPSIGKNKGTVVNAPINTPDILPSLLGLANIKIPATVEGENIATLIKNPDPNADRAALVMNVSPFGSNIKDSEYRAIRTKQYTYAKTPEGASALFDNLSDPYQMNNLLNKPEVKEIQQNLDQQLNAALNDIGDEFKPRDFYMKKWNYTFDKKRNAIDWRAWNEGKGVLQSPIMK
ncbi:Arylsulfatase A [Lutibacter agarilyticus]|uniref:Arylsulfatase A n=1 Tax=Lutibacter agarilyticus TaxID=1109740 RepID=A0A238YLK1_9FLAO|nr:sulfatase [Lutibacter agarilyticus]SNR71493.1 Arylsulfatase A [Lutibacter agarilyticus]